MCRKLREQIRIPGVEIFIEPVREHRFVVVFRGDNLGDAVNDTDPQQTGHKPGLVFTLGLATFGWIGVRGMNWFLFGRYGAPPLLAFISRQPLAEPGGA